MRKNNCDGHWHAQFSSIFRFCFSLSANIGWSLLFVTLSFYLFNKKDATEKQKEIKEIFTGILATRGSILTELIPKIDNNNSAKEFYLTDLIGIASDNGFKINTLTSAQNETMGANSRIEQEELERALRTMNTNELLNKYGQTSKYRES